jgi:hypothetical protein
MDDKIEPSWPDERDEIIDKVQRGEMSPSEAQALVTERKLQPLKREPDLTEFDPLNEPDWTLLMAVTWIAYHSSDYVRKVWDKYREKCWNWSPCTRWRAPSPDGRSFVDYKGHFLKQETDASFEQLCLEEIVSLLGPPVPDDGSGVVKRHCVRPAREGLEKALREGTITATGLPLSESIRKPIAAFEWHDLTMFDSNQDQDRVCREGVQAAYAAVTLRRDDVLRLWPKPVCKVALEPLLRDAVTRNGGPIPQTEAIKIAGRNGATESREEIRQLLEAIQGKQNPGPRGSRKNRAEIAP